MSIVPAAAATAAPARPQRTSTPRWKRANVCLGKVIPSLLLLFGLKAYKLVVGEVVPLLYRKHRVGGIVYCAWIHIMLAMTAYSYFKVYFEPLDPPAEREPPPIVQEKRTIFACDRDGEPLRCYRDRCITTSSTFKSFFCFLVYAFILLMSTLAPLAPLQYRAAREVLRQTWNSGLLREKWWSKWWSWAGGPVWRYAGGLFFGFKYYTVIAPDRPLLVDGVRTRTLKQGAFTYAYDEPLYPSLAVPSLNALLLVGFALMICAIAVA
ncbi:hypothetical protein JCM6882_005716, partial [Rhodosporidiobolus microsporus]